MKMSLWKVLFIVLAFMITSSTQCIAGAYDEFVADWVEVLPGGDTKKIAIIYVSNGKVLFEMAYTQNNQRVDSFMDHNTKRGYFISYIFEKYWDGIITKEKNLQPQQSFGLGTHTEQRDIIGKEKVNGFDTVKSRVTTVLDVSNQKIASSYMEWKSKEIFFALRAEISTGKTYELRNIVCKPVPVSKFSPPKGFKKITHISQMSK